jgi:hypothetical protein
MNYHDFSIGDYVVWETHGYTKVGKILKVIPKESYPPPKYSFRGVKVNFRGQKPRSVESYLVLCQDKYPTLYWPRTRDLKKYDPVCNS